jgi:hypothetical protein
LSDNQLAILDVDIIRQNTVFSGTDLYMIGDLKEKESVLDVV